MKLYLEDHSMIAGVHGFVKEYGGAYYTVRAAENLRPTIE